MASISGSNGSNGSNHNQRDSADRRSTSRNRSIESARTAPDSERGLTHSPYFNGSLCKRMSEDLHLGSMAIGIVAPISAGKH